MKCTLPPLGWECTRKAGHEGPCAAVLVITVKEALHELDSMQRQIIHGPTVFGDIAAVIRQLRDELEGLNEWLPIAAAPHHLPIRVFNEEWIDEDFNPTGSYEAFWQDDEGWKAAVWNNDQDCYDTRIVNPTHWKLLPTPPVPAKC